MLGVQAPAADPAALRDDHALGAGAGTVTSAVTECDLFLMLMTDASVTCMPRNSICVLPRDELRPAGDVGVDALVAAIVERQDVVLHRLDQPQPLQLGELLRMLGDDVVRLRPVVGRVELPDVGVERAAAASVVHGVLCLVTAVQPW